MNRKKKASNLGLPMLILLFVAGAIVATGGIGYVVLKNKQVTARRNIIKVHQRTEEHRIALAQYEWKINDTLAFYRLRARLEERQSDLVPIENGVVERIISSDQETPPGDAVVSR
ncbi:hypothetical protein N9A94_05710 [Akkermansiaceae bacterium]|nr:hypothetical protein [Akkermansiaceae bacterium]